MIADYFRQSTVRTPIGASNADGSTGYGSPQQVPCRMQFASKLITTPSGKQVVSTGNLFVAPTQAFNLGDLVTWAGRSYEVLAIDEEYGFDSLDHKLVWF